MLNINNNKTKKQATLLTTTSTSLIKKADQPECPLPSTLWSACQAVSQHHQSPVRIRINDSNQHEKGSARTYTIKSLEILCTYNFSNHIFS